MTNVVIPNILNPCVEYSPTNNTIGYGSKNPNNPENPCLQGYYGPYNNKLNYVPNPCDPYDSVSNYLGYGPGNTSNPNNPCVNNTYVNPLVKTPTPTESPIAQICGNFGPIPNCIFVNNGNNLATILLGIFIVYSVIITIIFAVRRTSGPFLVLCLLFVIFSIIFAIILLLYNKHEGPMISWVLTGIFGILFLITIFGSMIMFLKIRNSEPEQKVRIDVNNPLHQK